MITTFGIVLNFRFGGQLSSLFALLRKLDHEKKCRIRFLAPTREGAIDLNLKNIRFPNVINKLCRSFCIFYRLSRIVSTHRNSKAIIVLPTAAFLWVPRLFRFNYANTIIILEGCLIGKDTFSVIEIISNLFFLLPRLILNNALIAKFFKNTKYKLIVPTEGMLRELLEIGYQNVDVINNLTDIEMRSSSASIIKRNALDEIWIGYIGHSFSLKGLALLAESSMKAVSRNSKLRFIISVSNDGDGEKFRKKLRNKFESTPEIKVIGECDVNALLSDLDCLVLPYLSLVGTTLIPSLILEANRLNCPILLPNIKTLKLLAKVNKVGISFFEHNSIISLTDCLINTTKRQEFLDSYLEIQSDMEILKKWHAILT